MVGIFASSGLMTLILAVITSNGSSSNTFYFIVSGILLFIAWKLYKRETVFINNNELFSQAGITIDYQNKTITVKKYNANVGTLSNIFTRTKYIGSGAQAQGHSSELRWIVFEFDDMNHPTHTSQKFCSAERFDAFYKRVKLAISKCENN